jgi:hypothetical protein
VVQALRAAVAEHADRNAEVGWDERVGLSQKDIERIVTHTAALVDRESLAMAVANGSCEPVDFDAPLAASDFYSGTGTQPGHIAAGLVTPRPAATDEVLAGLGSGRAVLIAGPRAGLRAILADTLRSYDVLAGRVPWQSAGEAFVAEVNDQIRVSAPSGMVRLMLNQRATAPCIGHYRVRCPPGSCEAEAVPGTSNLEREIFANLNPVFGGGKYDYAIPDRNGLRSDMAFLIDDQLTLVIEYDGAHWHIDHEPRDRRKIEMISGDSRKSGSLQVVRIREDPLRPLSANDVWVPKRADAYTCSRLALQHVAHRFFGWTFGYETRIRIEHFLASASTPLTHDQVPCGQCWRITRAMQRAQAKLTPVLPPPWAGQIKTK